MPPVTVDEVLERATRLVGAPFHLQGRSAKAVDCLGTIAIAFGLVGSPHDRRRDYDPETAVAGELRAGLLAAGFREIPVDEAEPADVLTFHALEAPDIERHVAIRTHRGMIHTSESGRVADVPFGRPWTRLVHAAYRYEQLSDGEADHG